MTNAEEEKLVTEFFKDHMDTIVSIIHNRSTEYSSDKVNALMYNSVRAKLLSTVDAIDRDGCSAVYNSRLRDNMGICLLSIIMGMEPCFEFSLQTILPLILRIDRDANGIFSVSALPGSATIKFGTSYLKQDLQILICTELEKLVAEKEDDISATYHLLFRKKEVG